MSPADGEAHLQAALCAHVFGGGQHHATGRAGKHKSGPGKQREGREIARRPHVPLEPHRAARSPSAAVRMIGRDQRDGGCDGPVPTTALALVLAPTAHTRPAATIAGPMTLRMSTRKIVTGWLPGLTMNACSRKRKARMKISRPRLQIARTAAPRLSRGSRAGAPPTGPRQSGQPQKQRRRESAQHNRPAERCRLPVGRARPGVGRVRERSSGGQPAPRAQSR